MKKGGDTVGIGKTFKALSDPTRREILDLLKKQKRTAGELASHFDMTQATVSHHLSVLKEADLILDEKKGKYILYEINTSVMDEIVEWITTLKKEEKHDENE
jgi:DNA-binding transcriptional ArsR family regulator